MLKNFFKEYPYLVIAFILWALVGIVMIFLGAFADIPIIAKCFLIIMGIALLVGSIVTWLSIMYSFEKLEMLKDIKKWLSEDK